MSITITKTFATEAEALTWLAGQSGSPETAAPAPAPAVKKPAAPAPAPAVKKPAAPAPAPASERSREDMVAALQELRTAKGKEVAKGVIEQHGGCDKMADIADDKIDAVYDAAKAAMSEDDGM